MKKLDNLSLFDITPQNLILDQNLNAIIPALDNQLQQVSHDISQLAIIYGIDNLDELTLNFLAQHFHADFFDLAIPLDAKRDAVNNALKWHMKKGTSWAILEALRQIGVNAEFLHWHDTNSQPYTFRLRAEVVGDEWLNNGKSGIIDSIVRAVNESKAARSLLEHLETSIKFTEPLNLYTENLSLLGGQYAVNLAPPAPPENNLIGLADFQLLHGQNLILPQRDLDIHSKLFAGVSLNENISLDIGVDLDIMHELLLMFEKRIFGRLDKTDEKINSEISSVKNDMENKINEQNKLILERFRILEDYLRWKNPDEEQWQ